MAEIFCRADGCSSGRGGSMHICDPQRGMMGSVPIVAATIPIATGAALASKLRRDGGVAVAFFGDGSTEEGQFHESLNLAAVQELPVIFVCENNLYSSHMQILERRKTDRLAAFGAAHGMSEACVDGNDLFQVHTAAVHAVSQARSGGGPTLIECMTFRWRGHVGPAWDMDVGVKRKDEIQDWLAKDPIKRTSNDLVLRGVSPSSLADVQTSVNQEIDDAVGFARSSPYPDHETLTHHVYNVA